MSDTHQPQSQGESFRASYQKVRNEVQKVIVGNDSVVDGVLTCLFAGGHVLLEGVPGLGKTLLVRTLAQSLHASFSRIQFTPDLMPADISGTNILVEGASGKQFQFQRGPIFANIVLADEINRATPKTQSAMLEAMQEHSVTVAGARHPLEAPFFVLATQNPIEMEGTYPLPEAQLDRFLLKVLVPSPSFEQLSSIVDRTTGAMTPTVDSVLDGAEVVAMQAVAREVPMASHVRDFAVRCVLWTHPTEDGAPAGIKQYVRVGSSPRGAQALIGAAKVRALAAGRYNVSIEDIELVAPMALRHRVLLNFEGEAEGITTDRLIEEVVQAARKANQVS